MRFMIMAGPGKTTAQSDAPPSDDLFAAYMRFNEELAKAGVLVVAEGLAPSAPPAQVSVIGGKRTVTDGPYAEAKELIGGFYLIDVKSRDEAIQWALRCPVGLGFDDVLEIRQMTGAADVPPEMLALARRVAPTWSATWKE